MNAADLAELEAYLTDEERKELEQLLIEDMADMPWRPLPGPQTMAWESEADIIGFGGSAGGGKTDLLCGMVSCQHQRSLVVRREKAQTEGIIQRLTTIRGGSQGYNSQKGIWRMDGARICEFAGLDNPGDERRWQGRDHGLKAFDEVTEQREQQVRFVMGWNRTPNPDEHAKVLMTFNPPTTIEGRWIVAFFGPWLDDKHPLYPTPPSVLRWATMLPDEQGGSRDFWLDPERGGAQFVMVDGAPCYEFDRRRFKPEEIITPKSRTFIPSRLTDNPFYMASGYMATLQGMPEPLRSQMLFGDFNAGVEDDEWQVIPTAWVDAAQARWRPRSPKGEMLAMGIDVARGGKDNTVLAPRHQAGESPWYFDELKVEPGTATPNGAAVAGLALVKQRDDAPLFVDVIGVGASAYDKLAELDMQVYGVNVSEKSTGTDKSGRLRFFNKRSEIIWKFRELLDPANDRGVSLPPDQQLKRELCAFRWKVSGSVIYVLSREEVIALTGVSPDRASAVFLASLEVIKRRTLRAMRGEDDPMNFDPYAQRGD